jgi:hypothetical protein
MFFIPCFKKKAQKGLRRKRKIAVNQCSSCHASGNGPSRPTEERENRGESMFIVDD